LRIFLIYAFEKGIFRAELMPVLKLEKDDENKEVEIYGFKKITSLFLA
jgi:hypothetical protein